MRFIGLILLSLTSTLSLAQYSSGKGRFSADFVMGCPGLLVTVDYPECVPTPPSGLSPCGVVLTNKASNAQTIILNYGTLTPISFPDAGDFELMVVLASTGIRDSIDISVTPAISPLFDVALCTGGTVRTNVTSRDYAFYTFDFGDGTVTTLPANSATLTHAYPTPSVQSISVRGYNGNFGGFPTQDNCPASTTAVDVAPLTSSLINKVEVLNTSSIQVDFVTADHIQYKLAAATNNATSFAPIKTYLDPALSSETVAGIRPDDNYYCFRLDTYDACTNTIAARSPVVCSANLDAVAQNNQNVITWTTAATSGTHPSSTYTLFKEGIALPPNLPTNQFSFTDLNVICNMDTSYQLIINYPTAQSISLIKNVTSFSSDEPLAVTDITATTTNAGVELTWIQDPAFTPLQYIITKNAGGSLSQSGTSAITSFTDTQYSLGTPTCYTIEYKDVCLNDSQTSIEACPIQLTATLQSDNTIQLNWSNYSGWQAGVQQYTVEKYDASGNLLNTFSVNTTNLLDNQEDFNNQVYTYVVYAIPNTATLPQAYSNQVTVTKAANVFYPSAFTPNSDALNDTFKVFGQYIVSIEFKIFNRWGEMMYESSSLDDNGWNGLFRGSLQPEGAYVFTATLKDQAGTTFERSGSFYLMRKK